MRSDRLVEGQACATRYPAAIGRRLLHAGACLLCAAVLQIRPADAVQDQRPGIPDQSYPDLSGEMQNLRQWQGRVLVLNFWASWCAPCLAEIRHLVAFQREFGDAGLQVVGLGLDDPRKLKNVRRSLEINYPVLTVEEKESRSTLKAWGNRTGMVPYSVIFDKQGKLVKAHRGILGKPEFDALLLPLLKPEVE